MPVPTLSEGTFSTANPPGLMVWLDASDANTTFQDSGFTTAAAANNDPVGGWKDKSGRGNHVIQATAGQRPLLKTNVVNGLPVVRGDGVDDLLRGSTTLSFSQPTTFFAVASFPNSDGYLFDGDSAGNRNILHSLVGDAVYAFAGTDRQSTATLPQGMAVWEFVCNGASSVVLKNGTQVLAADTGAQPIDVLRVFTSKDALAADFFEGDLATLLIYNGRSYSAVERALVRRYLGQRYGVAVV